MADSKEYEVVTYKTVWAMDEFGNDITDTPEGQAHIERMNKALRKAMQPKKDEIGFSYDKDGFTERDIPYKIPAKDYYNVIAKLHSMLEVQHHTTLVLNKEIEELKEKYEMQQQFLIDYKMRVKMLEDRVFEGKIH